MPSHRIASSRDRSGAEMELWIQRTDLDQVLVNLLLELHPSLVQSQKDSMQWMKKKVLVSANRSFRCHFWNFRVILEISCIERVFALCTCVQSWAPSSRLWSGSVNPRPRLSAAARSPHPIWCRRSMPMQMANLWQLREPWPSARRQKFSSVRIMQVMTSWLLEKTLFKKWNVGGNADELCHTLPEISIPISSSTWLTISWVSSSSSEASKISSRVSLT